MIRHARLLAMLLAISIFSLHSLATPSPSSAVSDSMCSIDSASSCSGVVGDSVGSSSPPLPLAFVKVRRSVARGHANHGWLNSYHTFSFASYQDHAFNHFHSLRVINEDRLEGGSENGFPNHSHSNFEIFSYVVKGTLRHQDSLGNTEVLHRGDVQFTSAGRGISHSEFNGHNTDIVHFIQIWVMPDQRNLMPSYSTKGWTDEEKHGYLRLILSPDGRNSTIRLHQDMFVYACLLDVGQSVSFDLRPGRAAYLHLIQDATGFDTELGSTRLRVGGATLYGGDGAYLTHSETAIQTESVSRIHLKGASNGATRPAEFLLFDIKEMQDGA